MNRYIILLSVFFMSRAALSQSNRGLYLPLEFQKAYKGGSRSTDGLPGKNYWQNHSDYNLKVSIDPYSKTLEGNGDITYSNNSPDTLQTLTLFLYPDLYAKQSARDDAIDPSMLTDGVKIEKIEINKSAVDLKNDAKFWRYGTRMFLQPDHPVMPHSTIQIHIEWDYTITANGYDRDGIFDSTSIVIAYWYPEVAVYDDIDGWNSIDFTGGVEFYHDYSNYKVEVTVPDNFLVWASVPPDNKEEIYPDFIKERLSHVNDRQATSIVTATDISRGIKVKTNTWKYTATDFPDFCFAMSDHYLWDARLFKNADTYFLNTIYPEYHDRFSVNLQAAFDALGIYTSQMPAYPFPFKYFTVCNALHGGGMEYPGLINDGFYDSARYSKPISSLELNRGLTYHEMFHMYFPFFMGINESKYSWMDEGWASFSSYLIPKNYQPGGLTRFGSQSIAPVMVPSDITPRDFYANSYTIGAYSYFALQKMLGDQLFVKCLNEYINRWHHKHPTPYDFFNTFNAASGKDLTWFWKKWYFDWGYMDLAIKDFNGKTLEIQNLGGKPVAASIKLTYEDKTDEEVAINPEVWESNNLYKLSVSNNKKLIRAELIIPYSGDVVNENNVWEIK